MQGNLEVLMAQQSLAAFVSRPGVANVLTDANARLALSNPMFVRLLAMTAMQNALADKASLNILAHPSLAQAIGNAQVLMVLQNPAIIADLGQPAIQAGLANMSLMSALNIPAFEKALAVPANHGAIAAGLIIKIAETLERPPSRGASAGFGAGLDSNPALRVLTSGLRRFFRSV